MKNEILKQVNDYYSGKVIAHGATPGGVDWNSVESQELRYEVLLKVLNADKNCTLLDFGCGYGGLLDYCIKQQLDVNYTGFDISEPMIAEAVKLHPPSAKVNWTTSIPDKGFDFIVASGIFNVRLQSGKEEWFTYIIDTLNKLNKLARKGFSFNILTSYSDQEYMKDYLYYADPLVIFDFCKKHFSRNVALLHDYELYEFSIIVRK